MYRNSRLQNGIRFRTRFKKLTGCIALFAAMAALSFFLFSAASLPGDQYVCLIPQGKEGTAATPKFVDGVPFRTGSFWDPPEGGNAVVQVGDLKAERLYILGGLNSVDQCHPGWGGGNGFENFFLGNRTGEIGITYASGRTDTIPMIMGYTGWISQNYKISPEPFKSNAAMAALLDSALCVANGLLGYKNDPATYYLVIGLRPEKIETITFHDNAGKTGHFKVEGLSFGEVSDKGSLRAAAFSTIAGSPATDAVRDWRQKHTVMSSDGYPASRRKAIEKLRHKFYTQPEDISYQTIAGTRPDISAKNFPGPQVQFGGSPVAALMTNVYYENAHQILGRVDDSGMVHESSKGADNFNGIGGWTARLGPFYGDSYTRIRALTLLSNMGFSKKTNAALDYFDRWMMYFPHSYPAIQLGGKPVPGHASVVANKPLEYFDVLKDHGWPTKYKTHDFGNGENDGHGMLMISRWRAWLKQGRSREWVDQRWEAIREAAEYIPWCLTHPELSFSEHGLLYSESEGGMQKESMFCDLNCYLGLLGAADMAKRTGRTHWAQRWQKIADVYLDSMNAYYPKTILSWGDVWDPDKTATWAYGHATLAPAVIGMDYWGYDVMNKLPAGWKERTQRTYAMQMTKNAPPYAASAGMGYGQGYITEAGLLLDQMSDASKMVTWMARFCFAPRLQHPYRVPEGAVVEGDGSVWRRWGDLGNLYQLGETVYTIQLILGIDDIRPEQLVLMPRMPLDWNSIEVSKWPVRTFSSGRSQLFGLSVSEHKNGNGYTITLHADKPIDQGKLRIGPFNSAVDTVSITCNGKTVDSPLFISGDSKWAWVNFGDSHTTHFEIAAKVLQ